MTGLDSCVTQTTTTTTTTRQAEMEKLKDNKKGRAIPGGQEVGPDVEGLIGELEEAEDAVGGRAARVSVAGDDAVLVENLHEETNSVRRPEVAAASPQPRCGSP